MNKHILSKLIPITIFPIAILSVQRFSENPLGNTTFWWLVKVLILLIFLLSSFNFFERENGKAILIIKLYLFWNILSIIRGIFIAETYWDWKGLVGNAFALLIPIIVFTASNKERLQSILSFFVKYALPFSLPFLLPLPQGVWGWYLFPVCFLILFLPTLKLRWRVIFIIIALSVPLWDLSARSLVIKYSVPILLLILYYLRFFIASNKIIEIAHKVFIVAPWILFLLAVSGIFNVFKMNEYIKTDYVAETTNDLGEVKKQNITKDSRTFMYEESLHSAKKYNYWVLGRSPARGNETVAFAATMEEITGRRERLKNEAGILNIFTWTGIIGVLLYFLVFYKASSLAINQSNNIYSKLIGLYVTFHWMYSWVENDCSFSMNTFTIWLMIGICFSASFRKMNNIEVKLWVRGIFDVKYIKLYKYIKMDALKTKFKLNYE